jgi:D-alanyl-D-alanine carboxypeptidase/D-alanyl-D-alanine-endopeptidase (penicillin-binding protein 4)
VRARPALLALASVLALGQTARADAGAEAQRWLSTELVKLAADPRIAPARVGIAVCELATGKALVRHRANELFNIASNVKLVTVAAALALLGPELRLKTVLYAAPVHGGTIEGDLYLKGFGDPSLSETDLWQLASDLHDRGVRRVQGGLVLDESYFDGQRLAPLFSDKDTDAWYRAPNGPLSLAHNTVGVRVIAAERAGDPARVLLKPSSSYLRLENRTLTTAAGRRSWVKAHTRAERDTTVVEVDGRVRLGYRGKLFQRRVEDPGLLVGTTLLDLLSRRGIRLGRSKLTRGKVPPALKPILVHTSEPLAVLLRSVNKQSNNFVAEQVIKVLGAEVVGPPGSWANGLKAVTRYLTSLRIAPGAYTMKNGSGLYDSTRFSPDQVVQVIREASQSFKYGHEFLATLPLAGADGTLGHRFVGSGAERYVRAKTGTLANVVTLSGVAGAATAKRGWLVFSICLNDLPRTKVPAGRAVADEMAAALVTFLER